MKVQKAVLYNVAPACLWDNLGFFSSSSICSPKSTQIYIMYEYKDLWWEYFASKKGFPLGFVALF